MDAIIRELEEISEKVRESDLFNHIPDDELQISYALPAAREKGDIAVLSQTRITTGSDLPITRMTLTAMRFDPSIRCVAVIRYSEEFLAACRDIMLEICSFDRKREPRGIATFDWGVAFCCEHHEGIPDIIYDQGCAEKDPLIRMLGENPTRVIASLNMIVTRIKNTNLKEE